MVIRGLFLFTISVFSIAAFASGAMDNAVAQYQYQKCVETAQASVPCRNIPTGEDSTQYSECMAKNNFASPNITGLLAECKKKLEAATAPVTTPPAPPTPDDSTPQGSKPEATIHGKVVNPDDNSDETPAPTQQAAAKKQVAKPSNDGGNDSGGAPLPPARPQSIGGGTQPSGTKDGGDNPPTDKSTPPTTNAGGDKSNPSNPNTNSNNSNTNNSSGSDSSSAQAAADADVASCTGLQSTATQCCNNPMSCAGSMSYGQSNLASLAQQMNDGPSAGQSINDYCTQMNSAGANSGAVNNGLGAVCESKLTTCSVSCQSLAQKYQRLSSQCGDGCDNSSIYQNAYNSLMAQVSSCNALDAQGSQMVSQGASNNQGTAYSSLCAQNSAAQPPSSMGNLSNTIPNSAMQTNSGGSVVGPSQSTGCQTSANSDACRSGSTTPQSTLGYSSGTPAAGPINVGNLHDQLAGQDPAVAVGTPTSLTPVAAGIVPNNGGGFGGSVDAFKPLAGAGAAPNARAGAGSMGSGHNSDILHGTRGAPAGGSPGSSLIPEQAEAASQAVNRAVASSASGGFKAFSLRDYLPGFSRDPHRGLANANADILGRGEDIFVHISSKMTEKCRLQVLYGCGG